MIWFKRALSLLAFGIVLYLFWPLVGELRQAAVLFRQAQWGWIVVAMLLQLISYLSLTGLNYLLLRPFQGEVSFGRLLGILPAMAFIEVAIPTAGVSSAVLRARYLGHGGYSVEASMFTLALETVYLSMTMATVALLGLWYLLQTGGVSPAQLTWLATGVAVIVTVIGWLVWAGRDRDRVKCWLRQIILHWNRLAQKNNWTPYPYEKLGARLNSFYDSLAYLGRTPPWLFWLLAIGRVVLDVATLGACFAAFHLVISPGVLLTGYGLTLLLSALAALPGGIALADVSVAVIYARLGILGAIAIAAALSYRLIAYWLVRFVGFISWQLLEWKK